MRLLLRCILRLVFTAVLITACAPEEPISESAAMVEQSRACIDSLILFPDMMADNVKKIENITDEMTTNIDAYKSYVDMFDDVDSSTTEAEFNKLEEGFPEYREGTASVFASGAQKLRRLRRQVLLKSPPVCASDLPPFPLGTNSNIGQDDFVKFEDDLRNMYEQWFNLIDAVCGCYDDVEREMLALASVYEWFDMDEVGTGEACKQWEPARIIYNEHVEAAISFVARIKGEQ